MNKNIRDAEISDAAAIRILLEQLGFSFPVEFYENKLHVLLGKDDYRVLVYELDGQVVAMLTVHFSVQIIFDGEFATIGAFIVDNKVRSKGIGKEMEEYCTDIARERGCSLIDLYSTEKRDDAHRFYERQGYTAFNKYFMKGIHVEIL